VPALIRGARLGRHGAMLHGYGRQICRQIGLGLSLLQRILLM
jgi:hypothetical protein